MRHGRAAKAVGRVDQAAPLWKRVRMAVRACWAVMGLVSVLGAAGCREAPAAADGGLSSRASSTAAPAEAEAGGVGGGDAGMDAAPPAAPKMGWLEEQLRADPRFAEWLDEAEEYRLQILVTSVEPPTAEGGEPRFEERGYRVDAEYVYPASAIKTFLAVATLRELPAIGERHDSTLDERARILRCRDDRAGCEPPKPDVDPDEEVEPGEKPTHDKMWIKTEVHKMLSYSDNHSYDRLYDIIGHQALNESMAALGFASVRFHHRMNPTRQKRTRRVILLPVGGRRIALPKRISELELPPTPASKLSFGTAYVSGRGKVEEPMDFSHKNYTSLRDMQKLHLSLLLPQSKRAVDLGLTEKQREIVLRAMGGKLRPLRRVEEHKPLLAGVLEVLPEKRVRYVNKAGRAYGFMLDNAYIEDQDSGRAMFVTVSIYANPNGVLNDNDYAYDETSRPFLRALGEVLTRAILAKP